MKWIVRSVVTAIAAAGLTAAWSATNQACVYDTTLLSEADAAVRCDAVTVPSPPPPTDASDDITLIAAMQSIDIGVGVAIDGGIVASLDGGTVPASAPLPSFGWDLDVLCTCPGASSCVPQPGVSACSIADDPHGRDNTGVQFFRALGRSAQQGNAAADLAMQNGRYGIVLVVTGYNGLASDSEVSVAIYASSGVLGPDGGPPAGLRHDGTDEWTVDPRYVNVQGSVGADCQVASNCPPTYVAPDAYVTNNVLVAQLGTVPVTFGASAAIGGAQMRLHETYITGTLQPYALATGGSSWSIVDGVIQGRWWSSDMLSNMATIPDPLMPGEFLCGSNPDYQALKSRVCSFQDIADQSSADNTGASCTAISIALGFTAEPAELGVVAPLPSADSGCQGSNGEMFSDSCGSP